MRSTQLYNEITGKPVTPKVLDWLNDLEERYGDSMVVRVMEDVAATGKLARFLQLVSDQLASQAAMRRHSKTPHQLDRETLLAMVRGQIAEPERPFIYDCTELTTEEYTEVLDWVQRTQRGLVVGVAS